MVALRRPSERAIHATAVGAATVSRVTAPWRLARRAPSGPSTRGTWACAGAATPSSPARKQLARGRLQQVVAADDLADALPGVVDDHREVVGGRAVVAADHEVVDDPVLVAVQAIGEADARGAGADAQRRRAAAGALAALLGLGELEAGAGVGALGQRPVGGGARRADLGARAEALVEVARVAQAVDRVLVGLGARGLPDHVAVPVEADRAEVVQLPLGRAGLHPPLVEVLHPHEEAGAGAAGRQPREQRRAEVADVQGARRARGEASVVRGHPW